MSTNNLQTISSKMTATQHYALRKLSVGVASVLLGTTVMMVNTAHADQITNRPQAVETSEVQNGSSALSGVNDESSNSQSSNSNELNNEVQQNNQNILVANSSTGLQEQDQQSLSTNNNAINTLGMSADSQNQRFVGLQQSLVRQDSNNESDDIVRNVHVSLINSYTELTHQPGHPWTAGSNTSFDLNLDEMSVNQSVGLGHIHQDSDTGHYMAVAMPANRQWVMYHSQYIGYLTYQNSGWLSVPDMVYTFVLTNKPVGVSGLIHLSVNVSSAFYINQDHPDHFRGVPLSHNAVSFFNNDGKITSSIKYTIQQNDNFTRYDQYSLSGIKSFLNSKSRNHFGFANISGDGQANMVITFTFPELNLDDVTNTLYGNNLTTPISLLNKDYLVAGRVHLGNGGTVLTRSSDVTVKAGNGTYAITGSMSMGVDSNGRYVDSWGATDGHGYYNSDALLSCVVEPAGLSLQQMRSRIDLSKNVIMISQQRDGSLLYVANFTPTFFNTNPSASELSWTINGYKQLNADSNSDKAYNNSLHAMNDIFHNRLTQLAIWQPISIVDSTVSDTLIVDTLDPNTGAIISTNKFGFTPNTYASKGQSTVKLHVITPSGVALRQVKSFIDWPNQNKHVYLSIPSITGYELVSNPQAVLSTLHLSGTAISASTQVDYPAENTVADYYVVLQPKTESANVQIVDADESNKVLATGTVSGRFGEQIVSSADVQAKLDVLLKTGHYVLASNGFDSGADYKDGPNTVTISLKHKLDSIQRHYRVIEDLPDGTQKVIIDVEATLYKDANVDAYQSHGAYVSGTNKLLKENDIKILVGQDYGVLHASSTWNDPTDDHFCSKVDVIPGYSYQLVDPMSSYRDAVRFWWNDWEKTVDLDIFNGDVASPDGLTSLDPLSSRDFHITYTRRSYPVTVNYCDLSGALVSSSESQHLFADSVNVTPSIPANYVLVPGQSTHLNVSYNTSDNQLDFIVVPRVTVSTDSRTVTRTIKVQTPDGQTNNVVQTVTFVRNSYLNQVTKETTYLPWSFNGQYLFSSYQPKPIDGYSVDVAPGTIVTPDSSDTMLNLAYHKQAAVYSVDYQLANGTVVKNVSVTPESNGMVHLTAPHGYRLLTPVTDMQVGRSSQKLVVFVVPDEQTYTTKDTLPSTVREPLTKVVTRKVIITMPNGRTRTVKQAVKFERTAIVNADGMVSYSNWQATGRAQFNKVFVPKRAGYHLTGLADKLMVTADMTDSVVNIKYIKN